MRKKIHESTNKPIGNSVRNYLITYEINFQRENNNKTKTIYYIILLHPIKEQPSKLHLYHQYHHRVLTQAGGTPKALLQY